MHPSKSYIMEGPSHTYQSGLLHRLFEKQVSESSSSHLTALTYGTIQLTFSELNSMANQVARILVQNARNLNWKPNGDGDFLVAVDMAPSHHLVVLLLAIMKAGGAYVPLEPSFPEARLLHILRDSAPLCVVKSGGEIPALDAARRQLEKDVPALSLDDILEEGLRKGVSGEDLAPGEGFSGKEESTEMVAMVLYTSGSTGTPKGVRLSHRAVLNRFRWQWRAFPYGNTELTCFKTALTFVDSVSEIFAPLLKGLSVIAIPKAVTQNPEEFLELLAKKKVSRLVLVPSLLRSLLWALKLRRGKSKQMDPLPHLTLWVCSGETLPQDLLMEFFQCFPEGHSLANFYGSTEVMGDVTFEVFQSAQEARDKLFDGKVPIGQSVDNSAIFLLNGQTLKPIEGDKVGEIFVAGANLALGYVNVQASDKFINHHLDGKSIFLFRTGDFGRLVNGRLIYEGRADSQIKVRGHRVDLAEIQMALQNVPDVQKAVVLCHDPGLPEQAILAFFTSDSLSSSDVLLQLKGSLTPYMVPDKVERLDAIPLLHNGKIDRQELLRRYRESQKEQQSIPVTFDLSDVPSDKMDRAGVLLETVHSVLGAREINLNLKMNFFQAGGNSLNAVFTVTRLNDQGYSIGIAEFLSAETLEDVVNQLQPIEKDAVDSPLVDSKQKSSYKAEKLAPQHLADASRIIASSFSRKGDLEMWTKGTYDQFVDLVNQAWEPLESKGFSFAVRDTSNQKVVAVAFNFDMYDEPEIKPAKPIQYVLDFLDFVEIPQKEKIPSKGVGKLFHSFMMGTAPELTAAENVDVILFMEHENMRIAKERSMCGLMTTNTSALTQHICEDILGYEPLSCYQVNQYVAPDGTRPFGEAPDDQTVVCSWKNLLKDSAKS